MRIKDYLGLSEKDEATLRTTSTFPKKGSFHQQGCIESLPPFERAMIERISSQARTAVKGEIPYPASARLLLSYTCTHRCSGCPYGLNRKGEGLFFDSNSFSRLLHNLISLKVKFIELSGGGEPTTHPEFGKFAQMCIKENFDLSLRTNGAWPDSRMAELLVRSFSYLVVNLDASDDETYNRIHHPPEPAELQRLLGNIERVIAEREREKSNLIIGAEARLGQTNMNFMEQIICLARDMGIDFIRFRINRRGSDRLLPEQMEKANQLIGELRNAFDPFPVHGEIRSRRLTSGCRYSPMQLTIDPSGDAYPCPHFERLAGINAFGNILAQRPEELWFGSSHKGALEKLKGFKCPLHDCRFTSVVIPRGSRT